MLIKTKINYNFILDNYIIQYYNNSVNYNQVARINIENVSMCVSTLCNLWNFVKNCHKLDEIRKRIETLIAGYIPTYICICEKTNR